MSTYTTSFSFEPVIEGSHIRVTVRVGAEGSRAKCGDLLMRPYEWDLLRLTLNPAPGSPIVIRPLVTG